MPVGVRVRQEQLANQRGGIGCLQLGTHRGVGRRKLERIDQGAEVQAGPPGDDGGHSTGFEIVDHRSTGLLELGHAERFAGVGEIDQMVGYAHRSRWIDFGGADVHAAIHLHRIDTEDLSAELFAERNGDVGLAGRGRPEDGDTDQTGLPMRWCGAARTISASKNVPGSQVPGT